MLYPALIMVHICGAVIGLLSGFLSILFRKGSGLHRVSGTFFFVSMLTMSAAGAVIAEFFKPNIGNVVGGVLTFYLVATAWMAGRRREKKVGVFDFVALLVVLTLAGADVTFGFQAATSPTHLKAGYPAALFFVFGSVAVLFAAWDVRMIVQGGVAGAQRIGRHLWRMCLALFMALMSFYPTRAKLFSKAINDSNVMYVPHIVLVVATLYWVYRVIIRRRAQRIDLSLKPTLKTTEDSMLKLVKYCLVLAVAGCLLMPQSLMAANNNLVDVMWLEKNLKNPNVLILDASSAAAYARKHIPGAVNTDFYAYGIKDVSLEKTEATFQSWGVSPNKRIVLYDQGDTMLATRVFFSLYYAGFPVKNLAILDGGFSKWEEQKLPVTKDVPPSQQGSFRIRKFDESVRARLPEFLTASGDPVHNVLLEALEPSWHYGEFKMMVRPGHIPNAVMLPRNDFLNADKTFKSPEEIKRMLAFLHIAPDQQIYTHCGGGVAASVPFFALKFIVGYPNVKLYVESEMGWLSDERQLPFWTYDAPFLMRDTQWLQFWDSQMLRTYLHPDLSIVDVRPAEAFNQGHLPYSLNIPADVFKSNINNPTKLAALLGPAGVDASHEAVIVSGAGLTKESALAFLMLEKLGQQKVSIFVDSLDQWSKRGFPVKTEATVVAPRKTPQDAAIPPTTYPDNLRSGVITSDAKGAGVYPRVLIASGANVPAQAQDGKVVHVPYTDLLNPDGTPKAAKDIWNILTKAGVPRFAELVCFSDDPAEAAANYYILKLMGFPDIKVLVI